MFYVGCLYRGIPSVRLVTEVISKAVQFAGTFPELCVKVRLKLTACLRGESGVACCFLTWPVGGRGQLNNASVALALTV